MFAVVAICPDAVRISIELIPIGSGLTRNTKKRYSYCMARKKIASKKSENQQEKVVLPVIEEKIEEQPARQVVEVVEEEPHMPAEAPSEDTVLTDRSVESPVPEEQVPDPEAEKQQELVEELFDRKSPVMPEISVHTGNPIMPIILWVVIVVVAALVTGGVLFFAMNRPTIKMPVLFAKPTPTAAPAPTPPPAPAVSRADVTIQVLNGGGTPGAASKMKKFLEEKGYTVKDVGNTDDYTYTKTKIMVHADKQHIAALLEGDLKDTYALDTSGTDLPQDASYDVRVIVGKE